VKVVDREYFQLHEALTAVRPQLAAAAEYEHEERERAAGPRP
jgi:hypothetical protein